MPILVRVAVLVAVLLVPVLLALAGELLAERPEAPVLPPDPVVPRALPADALPTDALPTDGGPTRA